jgi:hypothetical protein
MPVGDTRNISLGLGTLEFGNYVSGVFQSYSDVGVLKAEVNIGISREVLSFETGRPLNPLLQEVIRERAMVRASLSEVRLATIKQALGQGVLGSSSVPTFLDGTQYAQRGTLQAGTTSVGSGTLLKMGGSPAHAYIGLRFTHELIDGGRQIVEIYKASPMGDLALPFRETDWNIFEVQFNALSDTTKPAGEQLFQIFVEGQ